MPQSKKHLAVEAVQALDKFRQLSYADAAEIVDAVWSVAKPPKSKTRQKRLTQELLKERLTYDPETGSLVWRTNWYKALAGAEAGRLMEDGYRRIGLYGGAYLAHRLIWLYVHGRWPEEEIDHINRQRDDNRLVNLREASRGENVRNQRRYNKTGYAGTYKISKNRWVAQIKVAGKSLHLGTFDTPEAAHETYIKAAKFS